MVTNPFLASLRTGSVYMNVFEATFDPAVSVTPYSAQLSPILTSLPTSQFTTHVPDPIVVPARTRHDMMAESSGCRKSASATAAILTGMDGAGRARKHRVSFVVWYKNSGIVPRWMNRLGSRGMTMSGRPCNASATARRASLNLASFSFTVVDATLARCSTRSKYDVSASRPNGCMKSPYAQISHPAKTSRLVSSSSMSASSASTPM